MAWSWSKAVLALGLGLLLVFAALVVRNHTDGKIPVTFVIGPGGVGGKLFIDNEFLGMANGERFADGTVQRDWRVKLGKHTAQLVTPRGDTLRAGFVAEESAMVEFVDGRQR